MVASFPTFDEIQQATGRFVERHSTVARAEVLGASPEGREVRAVHVTDPEVPDDDKQHAMVVCGRHGNEPGGPAVGLAVLDWLASDAADQTRRRQIVSVVPAANPDGCARGEFGAPPRHLSELEHDTIAAMARRLAPEAVIDVHSFGPTDADLQAVVTGNNTYEGEDFYIYSTTAAGLIAAAGREGYPFLLHTEKRNEGYNNFIAGYCYDRFHALAFGMEVNHHVLAPDEAGAAGAAVVKALLDVGNARAAWQAHGGYPVEILKGDFAASIRPIGRTAAERRASRAAIWPNRKFFRVGRREAPAARTVIVRAGFSGYSGDDAACGFELCCRVRGRHARLRVTLNGEPVEPRTFRDDCSTFASVAIRPPGCQDYELVLEG
ncbi:MAG TPA: M14 family zinc carboxypeptidase [Phycisphaerae bacterium]|nr:M14 family zinc carboxypeptidase [Phycisphaerae bacterium]